MLSLDSIKKGKSLKTPRLVIYGAHGVGKSTFLASAPSPIIIQTEDGLSNIAVPHFPLAQAYSDVSEALNLLLTESHDFQSVGIDSLDWLERLIFQKICRDAKVGDIGEIPYGRGYVTALNYWNEIIQLLNRLRNEKNMICVLSAHAQIIKIEDPLSQNYDKFAPDLDKRSAPLLMEWADIVGFAQEEMFTQKSGEKFGQATHKAIGSGRRMLRLNAKPAFEAKNRFGLPDIEFNWEVFAAELSKVYQQ